LGGLPIACHVLTHHTPANMIIRRIMFAVSIFRAQRQRVDELVPISSPNSWLISGAVIKSPSVPIFAFLKQPENDHAI
jgi:hypothetical protein